MEEKKYVARPLKRPSRDCEKSERPTKRPSMEVVRINDDDDGGGGQRLYKFRLLLPNGMSLGLKIRDPQMEMSIEEFVELVKEEYFRAVRVRQTNSQKPKRRINWKSNDLHFVDVFDNVIARKISFKNFMPHKYHILTLHDGSGEAETYENMWDLTPDTELLMELPAEYTFETALADLIDNSLQAVWSNGVNERRLISVELDDDRISIFDTGPGMDGSDENSIVKWGKMGASLHRSSRGQGIGGKPPYLTLGILKFGIDLVNPRVTMFLRFSEPFFGMFGYGGPIASMHLGRHALVSSKTKESKKVYILRLEREALLCSSGSEKTWRTDGGIRHPTEDEIRSPQHSFTKVEIFEPKMRGLDIVQLQCKLKDIYFPYIQCDEVSNTGRTIMPIEFEVNGTDLAEIHGGEVAITNLHSCNGPEFVLQLHFSQDVVGTSGPASKYLNFPEVRASKDANARLKFVYFPIVEGKESIDSILEKLEAEGCGITENFENFSHVSVRRLGRLLPDARWTWIPFMEPRPKKGEKAQILKRCCTRVKCFIDTDAGFNPTPSKTNLAHHHPYTTALKNFGDKPLEKDKEVKVKIYKDGKQVTLLQLEQQYQEWIFQMHNRYDEEIDHGEDQPLLVVSPSNKKKLGISADVVRVHKELRRKGAPWKSGQKIKVLKGACAGCHKNNVYATLEYILLEGFEGDAGGEARLICRPLSLASENGCSLAVHDGNAAIDMHSSLSLPISVIDSGKCLAIENAEWEYQVEKLHQKMPTTIEILSARDCQELEIEGALPTDSAVYAGHAPPKKIVAVVRPASFNSASASKNLDQKHIVKEHLEMSIKIKFRDDDKSVPDVQHIYSGLTTPSSHKGLHGLYIFPLGCKFPTVFQKAGVYTFSLSIIGLNLKSCERTVKVKALSEVGSWRQLSDGQSLPYNARVGSCFPPFSIACYDIYGNRTPFASVPELMIKIMSGGGVIANVHGMTLDLSSDKLTLKIKNTLIESNELDKIRPNYEATLVVSPQDELFIVSIPCQVVPGSLQRITTQPRNLDKQLLPGHAVKELVLEMFDAYGNHVEGCLEIVLNVDGFCFQDHLGPIRKVDVHGCIDLSGLLKVTGGYGRKVSLSVLLGNEIIFKKEFQTEKRELRVASRVPEFCTAGSLLENLVFEIINSDGDVDETIHDEDLQGQSHMLMIKSESLDTDDSVRYSFHYGRCIVRAVSLPQKEGLVCLEAAHSRHPELHLTIEVHVLEAPKVEPESIQPQYTDGKVFLLEDSSALKTSKVEHDGKRGQFSDGKILLLQDSSAPKDLEDLVASVRNDQKELEEAIFNYGLAVGHYEKALEMLHIRRVTLEHHVSVLQANLSGKEAIMELIESKTDSAAAVVCRLFREIPLQEQQNNFIAKILGIVAFLGTVKTKELSRILTEYLGEDLMLAIVCKSYASAYALEKYERSGNVNHACALHAIATKQGQSIKGRYLVICLEDVRPYTGELGDDPERKLALPDPTLPNGNTPSGYLGYAVNMVGLDARHLHIRTNTGHGLRETLFYGLFGNLQVYETRENMKMAKACIKHGAVSLDGGIMKGNGVLSLGHWEPEICFPVIVPGTQTHFSQQSPEILKQIEETKFELKEVNDEIEKDTKIVERVLKKFKKTKERYVEFLDKKVPLLSKLNASLC